MQSSYGTSTVIVIVVEPSQAMYWVAVLTTLWLGHDTSTTAFRRGPWSPSASFSTTIFLTEYSSESIVQGTYMRSNLC
jgi:hypothetical protein